MRTEPLLNQLRGLRRWVRALRIVRGAGQWLAAAMGLLVLLVLLDYGLNLPTPVRLVLIVAALGVLGWILLRHILGPAIARLSLEELAGQLELAFPQFADRLRSTVNFLARQPAHDTARESEVMRRQVIQETDRLVETIDLRSAIQTRPAWQALSLAVAAVVLVVGLSLLIHRVRPQFLDIAFSRLFTPFHAQPWPKSVQIALVGATPRRVPAGRAVEVKMRLMRGDAPDRRAILHYRYGNGPVQLEEMSRSTDGVYQVSLSARNAGAAMTYWIEAGDDQTAPQSVEVVPPLAIQRVSAVITPPAYVANASPVKVDLSTSPAVAVIGSKISLDVQFNQPLADPGSGGPPVKMVPLANASDAATRPGDSPTMPKFQWTQSNKQGVVGSFVADHSLRFHIRATDQYGFANSGLEEYELVVKPDQLPSIQIESPRHGGEWTPEAIIPLQGTASDDYGLESASLVVDRISPDKAHWEIPLVRQGQAVRGASMQASDVAGNQRRYRIGHDWALASALPTTRSSATQPAHPVKIQAGDVLEIHLRARDNFQLPGAPRGNDQIAASDHPGRVVHRPVTSGKLRLTIISDEAMIDRLLNEFRQLRQGVAGVRDAQQRTGMETDNLAQRLADQSKLSQADHAAIQRLRDQQTSTASAGRQMIQRLDAMRRKMAENHLGDHAQDLARMADAVDQLLKQAVEQSMREASTALDKSADQSDAKARRRTMQQARAGQEQALRQLSAALDRLKDVGSLRQSLDAIARLLQDQKSLSTQLQDVGRRNLGKTLEQLSPEDRAALEKLAKQQKALADQSRKALDKMSKTAQQLKNSDAESAQAMNKAAQTARQQQVVPRQQQAAREAEQNRQSQAQQAQQQAELGLQMILGQLQEAQRHKMEQLTRHLADLRRQVEHLLRRQARHNLDNLQLQGPQALQQTGKEAVQSLQQDAGSDSQTSSGKPTLEQLETSQSLTERNTRDIAKSANSTQNGADVAVTGQLIRAAGQMAQALDALNQKQLAKAYDPSQAQALASLKDALKEIVQHQEKLQKQLAEHKRETIRQAYVKIRDDQAKLNQQVTILDRSPRLEDGQFNRVDRVRLNQLTAGQKELTGRIETLDKDLTSLDSIVYLWANQQIAQGMRQSQADLDKPQTGRSTQLRQGRIVAMLDDMIKNLAIQPRQSEFEQRQANSGGGGGGGGGSQKPQLPAETELRLLKALQEQVNGNTKAVAADKTPTANQLADIGQRQKALRGLLDTLLQKASQGKVKLDAPPPNKNILPEEKKGKTSGDSLEQQLLGGKDGKDNSDANARIDLLGTRMARSHERLSLDHDPGEVTQEIQKNIVKGLDDLIQQSCRQMASRSSQNSSGDAQAQRQSRPGENPQGQPDNQQANGQNAQPGAAAGQAAGQASPSGSTGASGSASSQDIRQTMTEWGGISPRTRAAVIDSAGETIIQKYRNRVEDYYRSLATKEGE